VEGTNAYPCKFCAGRGQRDEGDRNPHWVECRYCRGTGDSRACGECGIIDKLNDGSCAMCDADIPVRPETRT
jgi:RecJ-like exonuclease